MDKSPDQGERVDTPNDESEADGKIAERRSLMRKFAIGTFAVPIVLASLSSKAAAAS